jgi:hypothetical protein
LPDAGHCFFINRETTKVLGVTVTAEQSAKIFKSVGAGFERLGTGAMAEVVLLNQILVDTSGTQAKIELSAQSPQPSVRHRLRRPAPTPAIEMAGFGCVSSACFRVIEMAGFRSAPCSEPAIEMAGFLRRRYQRTLSRLIPTSLASFRGCEKRRRLEIRRRHEDDFGYHAKKDNSAFLLQCVVALNHATPSQQPLLYSHD